MSNKKGTAEAAPQNNYIDNTIKHEVLSILKQATEPIPQEEILSILRGRGIKADKRVLRTVRDQLVKDGVPVCSLSRIKGYWIAKNNKERDVVAKELNTRGETTIQSANALLAIDVEEYRKNEM